MPDYVVNYFIEKLKTITGIMACIVLGHLVVAPVLYKAAENVLVRDMVLGLILYFLAKLTVRTITVMRLNQQNKYNEIKNLPKTKEDITKLGIQNPVDYCVMMQMYFGCYKYDVIGKRIVTEDENQNINSWTQAAYLFKSYFGTNLHGWTPMSKSDFSWGNCLTEEAKLMLKKKQSDDISDNDIWNLISPTIKNNLALQRPGGENT